MRGGKLLSAQPGLAVDALHKAQQLRMTPFEQDIFALCDLFLTPGIHEIFFRDTEKSHQLVTNILKSLSCYSRIACLSLRSQALPENVTDLYGELCFAGALARESALDIFLIEYFYYDFLWIDTTPSLIQSSWFWQLRRRLEQFGFSAVLPIIILAYD